MSPAVAKQERRLRQAELDAAIAAAERWCDARQAELSAADRRARETTGRLRALRPIISGASAY
jgi:hypothetical protein